MSQALAAFYDDDQPEVTERTHSSLYRCACHPPANGHHYGEDLLCLRCALPWPQESACNRG